MATRIRAVMQQNKNVGLSPNIYNEPDVIRIILDVAGKYDVPTNSPGIKKRELVANLDYTDDLLHILQIQLDKYVKGIKSTAGISSNDLGNADTVSDVIDIVVKSLN
jgi:hypothetical protein